MILIVLLATAATLLWVYLKYVYSYWKRKGFPYIEPKIPLGNLSSMSKREKSFGTAVYDLYNASEGPIVGIYLLFRPALLIRDAELSKAILTSDFSSFHDRGVYVSDKDKLSQNLFALQGNKWKALRNKLTPAFSSGKLKNMFPSILNISKIMTDYLNFIVPLDNGSSIVEMRDVCSRFALDIIANLIFGLEVNSFAEPNNHFRRVTEKINDPGLMSEIRILGTFLCPKIFNYLPIASTDPYISNFMINIIKKTISHRENTNECRKDFIQLLIQLRNTGKINLDDSIWDVETVSENLKSMPIEVCAAQAFLFYVAGTETTAAAIAFCLYELTQNEEIMNNVLNDIKQGLDKNGGSITYDSLNDMKYLDLCLMETLRKYPGLPLLNRESTEDFKVPNTDYVIEKGTPVVISLLGMGRDPKYFPDPLKFDPERYTEGSKNYTDAAFLPFGDGPRSCIAKRLGKITSKVALIMLLSEYKFEAIEKKELEFKNHSVTLLPEGGIKLKVSRKVKQN